MVNKTYIEITSSNPTRANRFPIDCSNIKIYYIENWHNHIEVWFNRSIYDQKHAFDCQSMKIYYLVNSFVQSFNGENGKCYQDADENIGTVSR